MGRCSVLRLPQPTLKLAQCLGQELFVEEARPPVSNLISGNYAPGPGVQNPLAGASWEGSPPGSVRKAREAFSGSANLPRLLCLLPRCPPQVGARQPHVPRCAESSRLGLTAGPVWPSHGRLCLSHLGMFVLAHVCACVCTCCACVCARACVHVLCVCAFIHTGTSGLPSGSVSPLAGVCPPRAPRWDMQRLACLFAAPSESTGSVGVSSTCLSLCPLVKCPGVESGPGILLRAREPAHLPDDPGPAAPSPHTGS